MECCNVPLVSENPNSKLEDSLIIIRSHDFLDLFVVVLGMLGLSFLAVVDNSSLEIFDFGKVGVGSRDIRDWLWRYRAGMQCIVAVIGLKG